MLRQRFFFVLATAAAQTTTLTIAPATQAGFFEIGDDVGPMNPHAYRPNEFVTNDFVFEGLVEWEPGYAGQDGVHGTPDDNVVGVLATRWVTTEAAHLADPSVPFEITFTLRENVSFHDGERWNATVAELNFDHLMGGKARSMAGFHDWYGMPGAIESWTAVDAMTFKLTFSSYYEAALRELTFIRPFRMTSPLALPSIAEGEISCGAWRNGESRTFGEYVCRGVKLPVGTGPYKVTQKLMSTGRIVPAADFNASCFLPHKSAGGAYASCVYVGDEVVHEVHFEKFAPHRSNPTYDVVKVKAYASHEAIKNALLDGSLDIAFGLNTLPPSQFISLATQGSSVVAQEATSLLNTRTLVLNSAGALNTSSLRKMVMGMIDRQSLYEGELAAEQPMETLFDPALPYCNVSLSNISTLAATTSSSPNDITAPLRFIYLRDVPHMKIIASEVIADLVAAGLQVSPLPMEKADYNDAMNSWIGADGDAYTNDGGTISFDIALSETWGPPYDATSKLFDMTYRWGSGEADAVATSNLESITKAELNTLMLSLSTITDPVARQDKYTEVLNILHNEAVFLPLTAKKNIAVINRRVSGFKFGAGEFDIPLSQLHPTTAPGYPKSYSTCGVTHTLLAPPSRVVTMNQGVTEFMLAMGLQDKMAGTAYLDDTIWPRYTAAYNDVPVLSTDYPDEATIFSTNADFIMGSYRSAFREYSCSPTRCRGIFSNATVGPCDGEGSDFFSTGSNATTSYSTCRPQLHAAGVGTWLEPTSCEDSLLRPSGGASEETVYAAIRQIGEIFDVSSVAEQLISEIKSDFDIAEQLLAERSIPLKAVWLDCVDCCEDGEVFVGAGTGAPNLLMEESGLINAFHDLEGSWSCVTMTSLLAANPDVMVIVDAAWDLALEKIDFLHNHTGFCELQLVQKAEYITIPFSASTLGPRNGVAALDLAAAAIHVTSGDAVPNFKSGVQMYDPEILAARTKNLLCPVILGNVDYSDTKFSPPPPPPTPPPLNSAYSFTLIAEGSVSDYTADKIETIQQSVADKASVPFTDVIVSIVPASVGIVVNIKTSEGAPYTSIAEKIDPYLTSTSEATELIGGSAVAMVAQITYAPPPTSSSDSLPSWAAVIIAVVCVLLVLLLTCAACLIRRELLGKPMFIPLEVSSGELKSAACKETLSAHA